MTKTGQPACKKQRCSKPARAFGLCSAHAIDEADRLYSLHVRGWFGTCIAANESGFWIGPHFDCNGTLQCAHLVSRGYHATRWSLEPLNAVALCGGHHRWFDTHPVEREDICARWMGDDWAVLRERAVAMTRMDLEAVLTELKEVS